MTEEEKAKAILVCVVTGYVAGKIIKNKRDRRRFARKVTSMTYTLERCLSLVQTEKRRLDQPLIDAQFLQIVENYNK